MRIALIGQSAFGQAVLEALAANDRDEIVGVFAPPKRKDKNDVIVAAAEALSVPVYQFVRLRDPAAVAQFEALEPELCVMAFVTEIVPMDMINAPSKGTIQYHPSLLPRHRGPSSINWPIVMGETSTGLSIFWPDEGLDTGPLLLQKTVEIGPDDTLGVVYFEKLFPLGVDAMVEAVELVRNGKAPKIAQEEGEATYEGKFTAELAAIDWSKSGRQIYDLIRGSDPQPGANAALDGERVSFYDVSFAPGETGDAAGTVIAVTEQIDIAVPGGTLTVRRLRGSAGKVSAAEFAEAAGLAPGARFGS